MLPGVSRESWWDVLHAHMGQRHRTTPVCDATKSHSDDSRKKKAVVNEVLTQIGKRTRHSSSRWHFINTCRRTNKTSARDEEGRLSLAVLPWHCHQAGRGFCVGFSHKAASCTTLPIISMRLSRGRTQFEVARDSTPSFQIKTKKKKNNLHFESY